MMDIQQPSKFCRDLAEAHQQDLERYKKSLRWRNPAGGIELTFNDYPIPSDWRPILWERAPVKKSFWQAAWLVDTRP